MAQPRPDPHGGDPSDAPTQRTPIARQLDGRLIDGKYRVVHTIAAGGFGVVYEVRRLLLGEEQPERLALKTIRPDLRGRKDTVDRFREEVLTTNKLKTEFVCQVRDAGTLDDGALYYMVMEYAEGGSLEDVCRDHWGRSEDVPMDVVERWFRQSVTAMCEAERAGVVHRDLKPQNILLSKDLDIRVADFGIARQETPSPDRANITGEHHWVGDPTWASPEQMMGTVTHRSDMYSLGATLHYVLTRETPTRTRPSVPTLRRKDTTPWLSDAIERMTQPGAEDRFESFAALAESLPAPPPEPSAVWWKRTAAASVLLGILAAVGVYFYWPENPGVVPWDEFRTAHQALLQQAKAAKQSAADLPPSLAELREEVLGLVTQATAQQSAVEAEWNTRGDETLAPRALTDARQDLAEKLTDQQSLMQRGTTIAAALDGIEGDLERESVAALRERLNEQATRGYALMQKFPALQTRLDACSRAVDRLEQKRRDELKPLRKQLESDGAELAALATRAGAMQQQNLKLGEQVLAAEAGAIAEAATLARNLWDPLDELPQETTGPEGLPAFVAWIRDADRVRGDIAKTGSELRPLLDPWWESRFGKKGLEVATALRATLDQIATTQNEEITALTPLLLAGRLSGAEPGRADAVNETREQLSDAYAEISASLRAAPDIYGKLAERLASLRDLALPQARNDYGDRIATGREVLARTQRALASIDRESQWLERQEASIRSGRKELEEAVDAMVASETDAEAQDPKFVGDPSTTVAQRLDDLAAVLDGYDDLDAARAILDGEPGPETGEAINQVLADAQDAQRAGDLCAELRVAYERFRDDCNALREELAAAQALVRPPPEPPEGVAADDPAWMAWDHTFVYPDKLRFDPDRQCYFFEGRNLGNGTGAPVPMRLVVDSANRRAYLVDLHESVLGEGLVGEGTLFRAVRQTIRRSVSIDGVLIKRLGTSNPDLDTTCLFGMKGDAADAAVSYWRKIDLPPNQGGFARMTQRQFADLGGDPAQTPRVELTVPTDYPTAAAADGPLGQARLPLWRINGGMRELPAGQDTVAEPADCGIRAVFNLVVRN